MLNYVLRKIFGTKSDRDLKRLAPVVEEITALEPSISSLSDDALRAKTDEFRKRLAAGETMDDILVEAFAVVREAAKRAVGMRPFDMQLMGGIVLHQGKIAEMATGEGKTLVATMPVYLNALSGEGVHVITVNDYLAKRDREWMGPIYEFLGLTVGVVQHGLDYAERQQAYGSDITYGTNNEFGFDYLRDNMVVDTSHIVQRSRNYVIVDEVDSILIDEARTPLIISGPAEEATDKYYRINRIIPRLRREVDYEVDEKMRTVALTEQGVSRSEHLLEIGNLYEGQNMELVHHVIQALKAHTLFERDVDYVVKDGEVIIVDEFTGRLMEGRRYSDGLHQALEAKENVKIASENQTLATITFQNFFKLYKKLAGMTGTADTEAEEFWEIYKLDVVVIPTNRPLRRTNYADAIYKSEKEKFNAVVEEIVELHNEGRPVLVGTISIEKSERLSEMLKRRGIKHHVLNAKYHEMEAQIVAEAGQRAAVTIATNMAGRGTDIKLGPGVADIDGLHVLGTERHEARRIDNQLRGRTGRQGDPGSSRFYLSLEDDLMRLFGNTDRVKRFMERAGMPDGEPLEHRILTRAIESAQRRVESHNFDIRKRLLEYDNVMNQQREVVYSERQKLLQQITSGDALNERFDEMLEDVLKDSIENYCSEKIQPDDWNLQGFADWLRATFGIRLDVPKIDKETITSDALFEDVCAQARETLAAKENRLEAEVMQRLMRAVMLQTIDSKWKDHLYSMDYLKEGVGLRGYGGRDPLVEYKMEAHEMFWDMIQRVKQETVEFVFKLEPISPEIERKMSARRAPRRVEQAAAVAAGGFNHHLKDPEMNDPAPQRAETRRVAAKVGRNDPCPCGSGKKYKKCCGV